jgi:hypothetical protein
MTAITRRTVLAGTAAAAISTPSIAAPEIESETAVTRVNRLAWELAHAMDDWLSALGDEPGSWKANVWSASFTDFAVNFEHVTATRELSLPSPRLKVAIEAHRATHQALEDACEPTDKVAMEAKGKRVTKVAIANWNRANRAERKTLVDLLRFKCPNDASRNMKAAYLQKHLARTQPPADALALLLGSEMF